MVSVFKTQLMLANLNVIMFFIRRGKWGPETMCQVWYGKSHIGAKGKEENEVKC